MRCQYSKEDLRRVYDSIVRHAEKSLSRNDVETSLCQIQLAAELQYIVNDIFKDDRLEALMRCISRQLLGIKGEYKSTNGTILFYDYFGLDNRGLTQQYLDALFQIDNIKIVYVLENETNQKCDNILKLLKKHNSDYYEIAKGSYTDKIIKFSHIIEEIQPSDVFCHVSASSPIPFTVLSAYPSIRKFLINITDHAFGIGGGDFYDYSFEFREYGAKVSYEKRGFNLNQLLVLPYYPWQENTVFKGFPASTDGKVVLFSGSYLYKIDDKENTFFNLVAGILKDNPDTIMFFAGGGDAGKINALIKQHRLEDRFYLLGNRTDIASLFKHIDIYIGTYPLGGGLMSQYAALNSKPILAYKTEEIEEIVCTKNYKHFVFNNKADLLLEANRLIRNEKYREEQSRVFGTLTASQNDFRESFRLLFFQKTGLATIPKAEIDYTSHTQMYINNLNNRNNFRIEREIMSTCLLATSWKMVVNVILNVNIISRLLNGFKKQKTS